MHNTKQELEFIKTNSRVPIWTHPRPDQRGLTMGKKKTIHDAKALKTEEGGGKEEESEAKATESKASTIKLQYNRLPSLLQKCGGCWT